MITRLTRAARLTLSKAYNTVVFVGYAIFRFPSNLLNALSSYLHEFGMSLSYSFARMRNRYPVYRITENGIEYEFFSFSEKNKLPFDRDTYHNCQILIGDWANPVKIDLQAFADEYDKFESGDSLDATHIIPSQKYKTYMTQSVLSESFTRKAELEDSQKIFLYASVGLNILAIIGLIILGA